VLPKAPLASKPSNEPTDLPHGDFGTRTTLAPRGAPFQGKLLSTDCLHADYRLRSVRFELKVSRGRVDRIHSGNREEVLRSHISVAMNRSPDPSGRQRPKSQNIIGNPCFDISSQSLNTSCLESLPPITGMQQILERIRALLAMHSDRSFSARAHLRFCWAAAFAGPCKTHVDS